MSSGSVVTGGDYFDPSSRKADLSYIFETVHGSISLGDFFLENVEETISRMAKRTEIYGVWAELVKAIRSVEQMKRNINNGGARVVSGMDMRGILVKALFVEPSEEFVGTCFATPLLEEGWERKLLCWMSDSNELRDSSGHRLFLYLMAGLEYEQVLDLKTVPDSYLMRLAAGVPTDG